MNKSRYKALSKIFKQMGYENLANYILQDGTEPMLQPYARLAFYLSKNARASKKIFEKFL